ncbi:GTP-binding protein, partial [Escherichia coli]|nr:GTP-binding protein [Escherichia coli]
QTVNDAARIRATGTPAIQVNTGKGCHLDAQMIADAAPMLLNKVDLLPYLNFDVEKCIACAREVNPEIEIILISA